MDRGLILETTFLVDLEREAGRQEPGPAMGFLEAAPEQRLCITLTTAGEMASGVANRNQAEWDKLFQRFDVLEPDRDVAWRYGQLYGYLRDQGRLIGANDLWIAATAVTHALPLVTRNLDEFRRVPELEVMAY
ncbi:MAG: type II toxin-antitoxin system VapC family toxin [Gemmatimonadota bacterium]